VDDPAPTGTAFANLSALNASLESEYLFLKNYTASSVTNIEDVTSGVLLQI
jgi:hypothetical protein